MRILDPAELSDFCFKILKYAIINLEIEHEYFKNITKFGNFFEENRRETLTDELHEIIENHQGIVANRAQLLYEYFFQKYYS